MGKGERRNEGVRKQLFLSPKLGTCRNPRIWDAELPRSFLEPANCRSASQKAGFWWNIPLASLARKSSTLLVVRLYAQTVKPLSRIGAEQERPRFRDRSVLASRTSSKVRLACVLFFTTKAASQQTLGLGQERTVHVEDQVLTHDGEADKADVGTESRTKHATRASSMVKSGRQQRLCGKSKERRRRELGRRAADLHSLGRHCA